MHRAFAARSQFLFELFFAFVLLLLEVSSSSSSSLLLWCSINADSSSQFAAIRRPAMPIICAQPIAARPSLIICIAASYLAIANIALRQFAAIRAPSAIRRNCACHSSCYSRLLGHLPQLRLPFVVLFAPPRPFAPTGDHHIFITPTGDHQNSSRRRALSNHHCGTMQSSICITPTGIRYKPFSQAQFNAYDKRSYVPASQSHSMPMTKGRMSHSANPIQCL